MGKLIIIAPAAISQLTATRGTDVLNLLKADPREAWRDTAVGSSVRLRIDLGAAQTIDTVFLGYAMPLASGAVWTIRGGLTGYTQSTLMAQGPMRAVDSANSTPQRSHALWHGGKSTVRYLEIEVLQPAGASLLSIGSLIVGSSFKANFNQEWGGGRGVVDTGRAIRLAGGGFAISEGVRLGSYSWSFGDLTDDETEALYSIQLQCGETRPVLVVEDPERSPGQLNRIHYAKFVSLKPYKRRNPAQTRWEMEVEDWS
tara:strand:- start:549 stop:1319 length:771 start_codon:yes stop_codon:yes gene_type:complete